MNYANMIEEKNLKKTFIIATLCSTLIGTFTSSIGLWDRLSEKRKQGKRDNTQDNELKQLRERLEATEKQIQSRDDPREDRRRLRGPYDDEDRAIGDNFKRSSALIQRQFDEGFGLLGSRFAQGDPLTENALQKQIIALQQTVIQVLQDALADNRQLSRADMARIVAASNAAREGSIAALRDQQYRLAPAEVAMPPMRSLTLEDAHPSRSHSSSPRSQVLALPSPKRASTVIEPLDPLFCSYALALQHQPTKPLSSNFAPGGSSRCPTCTHVLPISGSDFWQIGKRTPVLIRDAHHDTEVLETREFHLGQRFVIKCHTNQGEFACVLCSKYRDRDAICRTVESLVNHVGTFHEAGELELEFDLKETAVVAAPPGSVVGSSAVGTRSRAASRAGSVLSRERDREFR